MAASKSKFRRHLLDRITPYLESQAFKRWRPAGLVPFACYERYRQRKRDLVDIQFDKYGRLAFFVNLASISGETVETMFEGVMPGSQITTAHLHEGCRLQGGRMSSAFKASWLDRLRGPEQLWNRKKIICNECKITLGAHGFTLSWNGRDRAGSFWHRPLALS